MAAVPHPQPIALTGRSPNGAGPAARNGGVRLGALRVPLIAKIVGANLVTTAALVGLLVAGHADRWPTWAVVAVAAVAIGIQLTLTAVALRPIRDLEQVARRVWHGDFGARVSASAVADDSTLRVGAMFNILLDGLRSDRERVRTLATEVIRAGDRERAALARELHDSTAQRMAALVIQLGAAARDCEDMDMAARLETIRASAGEMLEEVRMLAHTVHPRVLDDLGLAAALQHLAREMTLGTGVVADVDATRAEATIPPLQASVLYRVAQEAVRNAVLHGQPSRLRVSLMTHRGDAVLEVHDDGRGFDVAEAQRRRPGLGLFIMRERVTLVDGAFAIRSAPGGGTTVTASVPVNDLAGPSTLFEERGSHAG